MSLSDLIALLGSGAAVITIAWNIWDTLRKRRAASEKAIEEGGRYVVKSATEIVREYRVHSEELRAQLEEAHRTIHQLTSELTTANRQIHELGVQLGSAQDEVTLLRQKVKAAVEQLPPSS